ncbi:Hypothetical protein KFL_000740190 [Klebsormidium nitens]|uniref:Uncharacterized protein n=1 Tax=Klebsormidium nitens TaxID=105231 RepID=A0A1Y1HVJ6_KLENI|nr:Hypothetical protein KFL_000740190 [Klebsormidium nitens]|eukprot:GAQ81219.1 Hypothetical protein KFL_000740190 [Klebsormidium nitens]
MASDGVQGLQEDWEDFGQKGDLTQRIMEVLQNYPEGTMILKELIQNADNLGASKYMAGSPSAIGGVQTRAEKACDLHLLPWTLIMAWPDARNAALPVPFQGPCKFCFLALPTTTDHAKGYFEVSSNHCDLRRGLDTCCQLWAAGCRFYLPLTQGGGL